MKLRSVRIAAAAALTLVPCWWQARIQAGDLSSHIYNSWLAQLIESGRAEGLVLVPQMTNVLFDLVLGFLFKSVGADAAQRVAVSGAVFMFVSGSFAFASAVSGRRPWNILPCIAMLAYGWVFHMGFFNFYLSLGLCLWAMALTWTPTRARVAAALLLLLVGYSAHALPVAWSLFAIAFHSAARPLPGGRRVALAGGAIALMLAARFALMAFAPARWSAGQVFLATGVDQLWVFDAKYVLPAAGLLGVWAVSLLELARAQGRQLVTGTPFLIAAMTAAGILIFPSKVLLPGYLHSLVYVSERMSLALGVCVCALLAAVPPRMLERRATAAVSALFFAFLFADERALNALENRMQAAVRQLPPEQRVVSLATDNQLRVNALAHMVDRACIGHCYSYANYEPTTAQFRVRVTGRTPVVAPTYQDSWALQTGGYRVKPADEPLYSVDLDAAGRTKVTRLKTGAICENKSLSVLRSLI